MKLVPCLLLLLPIGLNSCKSPEASADEEKPPPAKLSPAEEAHLQRRADESMWREICAGVGGEGWLQKTDVIVSGPYTVYYEGTAEGKKVWPDIGVWYGTIKGPKIVALEARPGDAGIAVITSGKMQDSGNPADYPFLSVPIPAGAEAMLTLRPGDVCESSNMAMISLSRGGGPWRKYLQSKPPPADPEIIH